MRGDLIESRRTGERRRVTSAALSVAAHAAVILLAVRATATADVPARAPVIDTVIVYRPPAAPAGPARTHDGEGRRGGKADRPVTSPGPLPPVEFEVGVPTRIDSGVPSVDSLLRSDFTRRGAGAGEADAWDGVPDGAPLDAGAVDEVARALPGTRAPAYPPELRAAGLEGTVRARFVIDTAGRVAPSSIVIVSSTHAAFADAVRRSLLASRYAPARVRGRKVAMLVEQEFGFVLERS